MNTIALNFKLFKLPLLYKDGDPYRVDDQNKDNQINYIVSPEGTVLISVEYNEQMLGVITLDSQQHNEYYNTKSQNSSSFRLIYEDRNHKKHFKSLKQFGNFIIENSIDIISMAKNKTAKFSEVLAVFLELGRVIKNHPVYNRIKEKYGITDLNQYSPRIEENICIFLTYKPTLSNSKPPLVEITLSLVNLSHKTRQLFRENHINPEQRN